MKHIALKKSMLKMTGLVWCTCYVMLEKWLIYLIPKIEAPLYSKYLLSIELWCWKTGASLCGVGYVWMDFLSVYWVL